MGRNSNLREYSANQWYYSVVAIASMVFGGMSVNYLLSVFFDKTIPFIGAMVIGLFAGSIIIPAAIIVWILRAFGVL